MASTHEEDTFVVEEFEISDESDNDLFENMSDDGETFSSEEDDEDVGLESTLRYENFGFVFTWRNGFFF